MSHENQCAQPAHTPGPWVTNGYRSPTSGAITVFNRPFGLGDIAEVLGSEADARLIAAAPELLEALQNLVDPERDLLDDLVVARKAIAKATGAQV